LRKLYVDDIKRLKEVRPSGRLFLETYEESMDRFKLKEQKQYRFVAHPFRESK
jgi:hypothetical protein